MQQTNKQQQKEKENNFQGLALSKLVLHIDRFVVVVVFVAVAVGCIVSTTIRLLTGDFVICVLKCEKKKKKKGGSMSQSVYLLPRDK